MCHAPPIGNKVFVARGQRDERGDAPVALATKLLIRFPIQEEVRGEVNHAGQERHTRRKGVVEQCESVQKAGQNQIAADRVELTLQSNLVCGAPNRVLDPRADLLTQLGNALSVSVPEVDHVHEFTPSLLLVGCHAAIRVGDSCNPLPGA